MVEPIAKPETKAEAILRRFPDFFGPFEPDPALLRSGTPGVAGPSGAPPLPGKLLYHVVQALAEPLDDLDVAAAQAERAHWVRQAPTLLDLEQLAALFNLRRYDGEVRERFRRRLQRMVGVALAGPGTVASALSVAAATLDLDVWDSAGRLRLLSAGAPFVTRVAVAGRTAPLELHENVHRPVEPSPEPRANGALWEVVNGDFDAVLPTIAVAGVEQRTVEPILLNLTTGMAIGLSETVPDGHELLLYPDGSGAVEGRDVTDRLYTFRGAFAGRDRFDAAGAGTGFVAAVPAATFDQAAFDHDRFPAGAEPRPLPRLAVGQNHWYFTARRGRFDNAPFDRSVFAAPALPDGDARFGASHFDAAVFPERPSAQVQVRWVERQRLSFEVRLPWSFVAHGPEEVASGRRLYRVDPAGDGLQVLRADAAGAVPLGTIPVGREPCTLLEVRFRAPEAVQETSYVFVANRAGGTVSVVGTVQVEAFLRGETGATAAHAVLATLPVGAAPCSLAALPDGGRVYVACADAGTIAVIDVERLADVVAGSVPPAAAVEVLPVGRRPGRLAVTVTDAGPELHVTNLADRTVSIVAVPARGGTSGSSGGAPGETSHRVVVTQRAALPHEQLVAALDVVRPAGVRAGVRLTVPPVVDAVGAPAEAQSGLAG